MLTKRVVSITAEIKKGTHVCRVLTKVCAIPKYSFFYVIEVLRCRSRFAFCQSPASATKGSTRWVAREDGSRGSCENVLL